MTTKRVRIDRRRVDVQLSEGAAWWLANGRSLSPAAATALGFADPSRASWEVFLLHFAHRPADSWRGSTRASLAEAGYGETIAQHIAADRCPPDDWRD